MNGRLVRSDGDRVLGGVCGGVAQYFGVDSTLLRLVAVVVGLLGGTGVALYLVAWWLVPGPRGERVTWPLLAALLILLLPGACCWLTGLAGLFAMALGA